MSYNFIDAEKKLREIISNAEFTFNGKNYMADKAYKPQSQGSGGETKTDVFFYATNLETKKKETFKISYKKNTYSFAQNKLTETSAFALYGEDWSNRVKKCTSSLKEKFKEQDLFYEKAKPLPGGRHVYAGSIVLGWRNEFEAKPTDRKNSRMLTVLENKDIFDSVWANANQKLELRNGIIKELDPNPIPGSGEPNYFLKMDIKDNTTVNEIFDNLVTLEHLKQKTNIYSSFIGHPYDPINMKQHGGSSRRLAVVVDWKVEDGKLTPDLNFENPLKTNSNISCDAIKKIITDNDLKLGSKFDIKKFKNLLDPNVKTYS